MAANIDRVRLEAIEKRRGEAEEIVKSRKRKLSELYTVSSLSRIRTTTDEAALKNVKDSLLSFLEKNDIQRGQTFNPVTLLPLEYDFDETISAPPSSSSQGQSSQQPLPEQVQSSQPTRTDTVIPGSTNSQQAQPPVNVKVQKSQPTTQQPLKGEVVTIQPSTVPQHSPQQITTVPLVNTVNPPPQNSSVPQITVQPPGTVSKTNSSTPSQKEPIPSLIQPPSSNVSQPPTAGPSSVPNSAGRLLSVPQSQIHSQSQTQSPGPSQAHNQLSLEPYKKKVKVKNPEDRVQFFDPENEDAMETLVLILKSRLPAKVAEVTPLSELYYLAQTLPLVKLMPSTHKAVTSTMFEAALTEGKINVVHNRIEELKRQSKWSLKQPTRFIDPYKSTQKVHWDNLLSEMNWMATDFQEEKKLKIATCALIAESIRDYWTYGKVCCVRTRSIKFLDLDIVDVPPTSDTTAEATPVPENGDEQQIQPNNVSSFETIDISKLLQRPDPSSEFTLASLPETTPEDFKKSKDNEEKSPFKLFIDTNDIKSQDKAVLDALPSFSSFQYFNDQYENTPLVPVSKSLVSSDDDTWFNVYLKQTENDEPITPAQQKGLFGFSSQRRLTASIKPPPPPSLKYLNLRTPTIWLPEDDQDLIEYVNMFSFNWGVVSAHLSMRPTRNYQSNIERRTPWQCFERYIQLNDTFQIQDMRGQNCVSSMKWLEHAHHIQATTKRRISPLGVGPDSIQRGHKRLRWASMFEAVRKCMRKRESVTRPNPNQTRKAVDDKKVAAPSPADLSKLKFERDKAIQEAYLRNVAANQGRARGPGNVNTTTATTAAASRAGQVARTGPQPTPVPGAPAIQSAANIPAAPGVPGAQGVPGVQAVHAGHQQRLDPSKRPSSVPAPGSVKVGTAIAPQGALPQLRAPNGTPYTPEQLQQLMQMKQRNLAQQQARSGQVSPSPVNGTIPLAVQMRSNSNPVQGAQMSQANGSPIPMTQGAVNGMRQNSAGGATTVSVQSSSNGHKTTGFISEQVNAVINQIQSQNPNMSKADVARIATQYLANISKNRQVAAAGNSANGNNGVVTGNDLKPRPSNVNSPRVSQSPAVQPKPMPVVGAVPTPQQILQQQQLQQQQQQLQQKQQLQQQQQATINGSSMSVVGSASPNRVVNNVPTTTGGMNNLAPAIQSPVPQLTPQQKAQLNAIQNSGNGGGLNKPGP